MKKYIISLILGLVSIVSVAQVPYFGPTCGEGKIYNYTQVRFHPGYNSQSFYTSFQYGITNWFDIATNYNSAYNSNAYGIKLNLLNHKNIQIGIQPMAEFDLSNNFKFIDLSTGLFLTGQIYKGLNYCSNTWWTLDTEGNSSFDQWTYLSYSWVITPMLGAVTQLSNNFKSDLVFGFYFPTGSITWYIWGANLIGNLGHQRVVIGFDFKF